MAHTKGAATASNQSHAATILIVDDHVALAEGFAQALERAGYRALVANAADFALHEAQVYHPTAIVLDFQMPMINGLGFLYRLRNDPHLRQTPVLVVTGQSLSDAVQAELRELGADVRLKPIGVAELLIAIEALVRRSPHSRPTRELTTVGSTANKPSSFAIGRLGSLLTYYRVI